VGTGLRLGELLGLKWGDLDLEGGAVHVRRTLVEEVGTGKRTLSEPKTSRAARSGGRGQPSTRSSTRSTRAAPSHEPAPSMT
jgi:integrase